jgi:hypothetical protein
MGRAFCDPAARRAMNARALTILDATRLWDFEDYLDQRAAILAVVADQRDDLLRRISYAQLSFMLVGLDDGEIEQLVAKVEQFKRVCACLTWRPSP